MAGAAREAGGNSGLNALARLLAQRIRTDGPISLADYMAEALSHPQLGYYATRDPLGVRGDFVTAPEVSQVFGELIGLWCADAWRSMGRPDPVIVAEVGPGRGSLAADALHAALVLPGFSNALRLHLVETSRPLRRAQAAKLGSAVQGWHDTIAAVPAGPLIVIANEFLDALPIRQLVRLPHGWCERRVGLSEDGANFVFVTDAEPSADAAALVPATLSPTPVGAVLEVRPAALALTSALGARLAAQGGVALFVDYGYFPGACGDTLQAVRHHRPHPVLDDPGEADITAHVDFAAVAAAAHAAGAARWGPVAQGAFLLRLGLAERAAALLKHAKPHQMELIESGCRRLIEPQQMGTLFKAMALADPKLPAPAGFAEDDAA
jgi:NADH dehydrogenase [ubiquinone] 1 alpha subcomplex assembly factor 7